MGRRKLGEDTKVTKMKIVPMSEKQDATLSVVWSAFDSPGVNEAMLGQRFVKSGECSFSQRDRAYISAQRES